MTQRLTIRIHRFAGAFAREPNVIPRRFAHLVHARVSPAPVE